MCFRNLKVIDFGLSSETKKQLETYCGSLCYAAPEIIMVNLANFLTKMLMITCFSEPTVQRTGRRYLVYGRTSVYFGHWLRTVQFRRSAQNFVQHHGRHFETFSLNNFQFLAWSLQDAGKVDARMSIADPRTVDCGTGQTTKNGRDHETQMGNGRLRSHQGVNYLPGLLLQFALL